LILMLGTPAGVDRPPVGERIVCVGTELAPVVTALEACGHRVEHVPDFATAKRRFGPNPDGVRVFCDSAHVDDCRGLDGVWGDADVVVVDDGQSGESVAEMDAEAASDPPVAGEPDRERVGGISEALKRRAMDEAPVGITVADMSLPDEPLVYVNDAFERLTGYTRAETLGRNCRFLQGPESNEEAVRTMREAIEAGERASVEILNYRKDGERFWNRVDIAPIAFEDGDPRYYVGFQTDISERKRAERAAERYAAALKRERETLSHVLDRIDGLLGDVTSMLVRADSASEVRRQLCACLTDVGTYSFAWVGTRDLASDTIRPAACGGDAPGSLDGVGVPFEAADPVAEAMRDGEVRVSHAVDAPFHDDERFESFPSLVAVPLTWSGGEHGVAAVYLSERPDGLDDRETEVLSAIGRTVAASLAAIARGRSLATDEVVELTFSLPSGPPFAVDLARAHDCHLSYVGAAESRDGDHLVFFDVRDASTADVEAFAEDAPDVRTLQRLCGDDSGSLFEFTLTDDAYLPGTLADNAASVRRLVAKPDGARLVVELSRDVDAREVVAAVREDRPDADLTAYHERERAARTRREFLADVESRLTARQLTALQKAFHGGFFEWPHDTTGEELAESMDISRSTYHQHLRAAERKLVEEFLTR
jgi:PAS domain S-box-containing protein